MPPLPEDIGWALARLQWMRDERIWPNGRRYLWTDAWGVAVLVSLFRELGDERYLRDARWVVADVERVLGRARGIRIGEAADRDGQYFHYLAMWLFALQRLGEIEPAYRERAIRLAKDIHPAFVVPRRGVMWKMREDLSGPYPGSGLGALDPFHGYVVYRLLDPGALAVEIAEMRELVERAAAVLSIPQDLGLGMMLWLSHFCPDEAWAQTQRQASLATLDRMWVEPPGYFCRAPDLRMTRFAFTNYGVSVGLQSVAAMPARVARLNDYFETYSSGDDEYDLDPITHVMACASRFPGAFLSLPKTQWSRQAAREMAECLGSESEVHYDPSISGPGVPAREIGPAPGDRAARENAQQLARRVFAGPRSH